MTKISLLGGATAKKLIAGDEVLPSETAAGSANEHFTALALMRRARMGIGDICWVAAQGGNVTTLSTINTQGFGTVGTATARAWASTNRVTRTKRLGYVSASTAGAAAGIYGAGGNLIFSVGGVSGGGFMADSIFATTDAATVSDAQMFVGMQNLTSSPSATNSPAAFTNCVGVAQVAGSTNLKIVYGGSAAQTSIDLGANFPAADATVLYRVIIYAPADDATTVIVRVEKLGTAFVSENALTGTAGTALPANTTALGPRAYRGNNASALAVSIDIASMSTNGIVD